ncbi:hypothetical protein FALCPG4_009967 [Fusarium falciforme]
MHPSSGDGGEHVPLSSTSAAAPKDLVPLAVCLSRGTPGPVSATPERLGIGWAWSQLIGKKERQAWVQESEKHSDTTHTPTQALGYWRAAIRCAHGATWAAGKSM